MHHKRFKVVFSVLITAGLGFGLVGCGTSSEPVPSASADSEELTELIEAAQAEGTLVFYAAGSDGPSRAAALAFEEEYGIPVEVLALPSSQLLQRFSAEAEAGAFAADVIMSTSFDALATNDFIPKGWLEPIQDSGIPAIDNEEFPSEFIGESTARILCLPWIIAYNSDLVDEADLPETVEGLSDPEFSGQLLTSDPSASVAYIEVWERILDSYGEDAITGFVENDPRYFEGAAAAAEALAAGEGAIAWPTSVAVISRVVAAGAPVEWVMPEVTTAAIMSMALVPADKAPHPNAARLFANFLLTPEGNQSLAQPDSGDVWVLDPALDREYVASLIPSPDAASKRDTILKLMGR